MRFLTFLSTLILSVSLVFAQSSAGDKYYNQGLQLQKTMTVKAQNSAIAKFQQAKKIYDSAAKKAQCDQAITVSQNIIKQIKSGTAKGTPKGKNQGYTIERVTEEASKLTVTPDQFDIDLNMKTLNVSVEAKNDQWEVKTVSGADGSSFLSVEKVGDKSFAIRVPENYSTSAREQSVVVSDGKQSKEVKVRQSGKPVDFSVDKTVVEYKKKGGKKKVEVSCNSDSEYADNNGYNWTIVSKPEWIKVNAEPKKEGGLMGYVNKGLDYVKGTNNRDNDVTMQHYTLTLNALPNPGRTATGDRKGEVILKSGDKTISIYVSQPAN